MKKNKLEAMIFIHKFPIAPRVLGHQSLRCNMSVQSCFTQMAKILFIDGFYLGSK